MKTISTNLKNHLSQEVTSMCTCWLITRTDGQVFAFTDHDQDIVYGGRTYAAATGFTASAVSTTAQLNVDNLDVQGMLSSSSISEADLLSGLWDYATVEIFEVNWADLTQGAISVRYGTIGEVKAGAVAFTAEIRGLMQAMQQTVGEVFSYTCRTDLGSILCGLSITPLTGTVLTAISQRSFIDPTRTETTSTPVIAIIGISQASPCVVATSTPHGFTTGQIVSLSNVAGMTQINGAKAAVSYIDTTHFSLPINTLSTNGFSAYTSGGNVALLVPSEFFKYGKVTWTSGMNSGLSMEVSDYWPNYVVLAQSMPFSIVAGDTYSITPGCDKTDNTCKTRFGTNNIINFRGEPFIPGTDAILSYPNAH